MSHMSDYLENQIIDHLFRAATFSKPAALYYALFTAAPSDAGGGTEVSGNNYSRAQLNPSNTNYNATQGGTTGASSGTGGQTSNAAAITFPTPSGTWGAVTHIGVFDASSGGNLLMWAPLTTAKTINSGDAVSFTAGQFTFTLA